MNKQAGKPFFPEIRSARFCIRLLKEADVSERYVSWFSENSTLKFITAAQTTQTIETLKSYVRENLANVHSFLLGIFTLNENQHIGNIKFDHIDTKNKAAVMGILIGDPLWRGKSVFEEVFKPSVQYLFSTLGIRDFWLGVHPTNVTAIKAYKKTGFIEDSPPSYLIPQPSESGIYMHYLVKDTEERVTLSK